jgi:predicted nucleic acid-binding protein
VIVIDASTALEVLLQTPAAARIEERLFRTGESLHAPHLIDLEIAQVLRRYISARQITSTRGNEALEDWQAFTVHRYAHEPLITRIWELRNNVTAYDAAYLALAEALQAPVLTRDSRLAGSSGHVAVIELL